MKEELEKVVAGILELAKTERQKSEPYKDLFKRTDKQPFPVQLMNVVGDMKDPLFSYLDILETNGYKLSADGYRFLLALPFLAHVLEKDIAEKDGRACCVDKTYTLLHQEFYKYLTKTP
jgi:hypothetical protein